MDFLKRMTFYRAMQTPFRMESYHPPLLLIFISISPGKHEGALG